MEETNISHRGRRKVAGDDNVRGGRRKAMAESYIKDLESLQNLTGLLYVEDKETEMSTEATRS